MASILEGLLAQKQPHLATHQALLVIGLQNDFLAPDGQLPVTSSLDFVERIKQLVPAFRETAGDIIWVRTIFNEEETSADGTEDVEKVLLDVESTEEGASTSAEGSEDDVILKDLASSAGKTLKTSRSMRALNLLKRVSARKQSERQKKSKDPAASRSKERVDDDELFLSRTSKRGPCCLIGTPGASFPETVSQAIDTSRDTVLSKPRYSAFTNTNLLTKLRTKLITELYVCGCMTNLSVYATALDAARYGLTINIIEDCLGYRKASRHEEALKQLTEILGAYSINSADMLADLASPPEEERKEDPETDNLAKLVGKMKVSDDTPGKPGSTSASTAEVKSLRGSTSAMDIRSARRAQRQADFQKKATEEAEGTGLRLKDLGSFRSSRATQPEGRQAYVKQKARMRPRSSKSDKSQQESVAGSSSLSLLEDPRNQLEPRSRSESRQTERSASTRSSAVLQPESTPSPQDSQPQLSSRVETTAKEESKQAKDSKTSASPARSAVRDSPERIPSGKSTKTDRKHRSLANFPTIGPGDSIGEGDSYIVHNILPLELKYQNHPTMPMSDHIFHALYNEVRWQRMFHAQGEVPRLVAVQGEIGADGSMPVYRHPSDQAPPLLHFSPFVQLIREHVQKTVKHPVNHVLIQLYRSGQDFISEHSDKTLDIVRGSSIVNVSFGAQRTMRLRTKKSAQEDKDPSASRTTQRIPMPHNSIFVLGQDTNMRWLHGINADKRLAEERSDAEKAYGGMRVSLTFRHIGTFLSADNSTIWGQGATAKERKAARKVVNNNAKRTEEMINAFGTENHSTEFDWKAVYSKGFDVLHFRSPPDDVPILFPSNDAVENKQVPLFLAHLGLKHTISDPPPPDYNRAIEEGFEGKGKGKGKAAAKESAPSSSPVPRRAVAFRDADKLHTEVAGALPVLLYLHRFYYSQKGRHDRPATARTYELVRLVDTLRAAWDALVIEGGGDDTNSPQSEEAPEFGPLERALGDVLLALGRKEYLHGGEVGVADCAAAPVLENISARWEGWDERRWGVLVRYQERVQE